MIDEKERLERKREAYRRYYEKVRYTRNKQKRARTLELAGIGACEGCGQMFQRRRKDQRYCCPDCRSRAWYERNREKVKEKNRAYRREHAEELNERRRRFRRENPAAARALDRKYCAAAEARRREAGDGADHEG